jgi:tetratricopeptide (TPR) repeat protein
VLTKLVGFLSNFAAPAEHESVAREAVALARRLDDPRRVVRALNALSTSAWTGSRNDESRVILEEALGIARELGDRELEMKISTNLGSALDRLGRFDEGRAHLATARRLARELGDARNGAVATFNHGLGCKSAGQYDLAAELFAEALELANRAGDPRVESYALANLSMLAWERGEFETAERYLGPQLARAIEAGDVRCEAIATGSMGLVEKALGRIGDAEANQRRSLDLSRLRADPAGEATAWTNLGDVALCLGRPGEAEAAFRKAREIADAIGSPLWCRIAAFQATLELQRGDLDAARRFAEESVAQARTLGEPLGMLDALVGVLEVELAEGREAAARAAIEEALPIAERVDLPMFLAVLGVRSAMLDGDAARAAQILERHEARLECRTRMELRYLLWKATGDAAHIVEANRQLQKLRRGAPPDHVEAMLNEVPLHAAVRDAWSATR